MRPLDMLCSSSSVCDYILALAFTVPLGQLLHLNTLLLLSSHPSRQSAHQIVSILRDLSPLRV